MSQTETSQDRLAPDRYSAALRELASGFSVWSSILLILFFVWQIGAQDAAVFFSVRTVAMFLLGEVLFVIFAQLAILAVAGILGVLLAPVMMVVENNERAAEAARIVHGVVLVAFGFSLCVAAWHFARETVAYTFG